MMKDFLQNRADERFVLCTMTVSTNTLHGTFCSPLFPTPRIYALVGELPVHGLWRQQQMTNTILFFWCNKSIVTKSKWKASLYSDDTFGWFPNSLHDIPIERAHVCRGKLDLMLSRVAFPSRNRLALELPNVLLHDESESHFTLKIDGRDDLVQVATISQRAIVIQALKNPCMVEVSFNAECVATDDSSRVYIALFKTVLTLSSPIHVGGWSFDSRTRLLTIRKAKYHVYSTARRVLTCASISTIDMKWSESALHVYSGLQFSRCERQHMEQNSLRATYPLLTGIKKSISTVMQTQKLLFYVHIHEEGIGFVGFILRHAIGIDLEKATPVLDLSVCFLSSATCQYMASAMRRAFPKDIRVGQLSMSRSEYCLFQNIFNYSRACMSPKMRSEHHSMQHVLPDIRARSQFRRVCLAPLYPSGPEREATLSEALGNLVL